jgi:hypothetical protein
MENTHIPNALLVSLIGLDIHLRRVGAFASTFSLLEIHDQDVYSLLDMHVLRKAVTSSTRVVGGGGGSTFYVGATFVAPYSQHEYICAVTVSRSLTPCGGGLEYFHRSPCES